MKSRPSSTRCGLARAREHQVVEDRRRQARLEQPAVELLQQQVAAVGVLAPGPRNVVGLGGRLERAVGPAEPVGEQLLAADAHVAEAGVARQRGRARAGAKAWTSTTPSSAASGAPPSAGGAGRAPIARRHSGASAAAGALGHARQAVAVARGLARRTAACRRARARARTRRTRAPGRGCGAARRGRARGRSSRRRTAAARRRRAWSAPQAQALGVGRERREHARRDVAAGGLLDQAGAQQVEREVAGSRADLERARVVAGRAAECLAHLREHLLAADLAEVDAPLGVVVVGRDVVVARVDVADLLVLSVGGTERHHILARRGRAHSQGPTISTSHPS